MVQINYRDREITAKIVYYGPALSGKTTNLQIIHECINFSQPTKFYSLNTKNDRTLFFDLLPISLGKINDFDIKIQLYTVPGQVQYNSTRKVVLAGCDAIVFVADSQKAEAEANLFSLTNMKSNLRANGLLIEQTPWVLQYNKRDLPNIMSEDEMNQSLNKNKDIKTFTSVAPAGEGVFETFIEISSMMLESILTKYRMIKTDKELAEVQQIVGKTLNELVGNYRGGQKAAEEAPAPEAIPQPPQTPPDFEAPNGGAAGQLDYYAGTAVQVGDPSGIDPMESTQPIGEDTEGMLPTPTGDYTLEQPYHPTSQNEVIVDLPPAQPQQPVDPSLMAQEQRQVTTFQLGQSPSISEQQAPDEQEFLSNEQLVETAVQANMKITEITNKLAESEQMLAAKLEELQHISELGKALTSQIYLDNLLEMMIHSAIGYLGVEFASINLFDKNKNYMEPRQLHNLKEDPIVFILKEKLISFLESITSKGKMAVITGEENKSLANALAKYDEYTSFISVSLKSKNNLLGVLNLYYKGENTYRKEDLRFVILLATYASIAIENALLLQDADHSKYFLNSVLNNVMDVILELSPTNRILSANEKVVDFLGYKKEELIGKNLDTLIDSGDKSQVETLVKQAFLGNLMKFQPVELKKKNKEKIKTYVSIAPLVTDEKDVNACSFIIHNVDAAQVVSEGVSEQSTSSGEMQNLMFSLATEIEPQLNEAKSKIVIAEQKLAKAIEQDQSSSFVLAKSAIEEIARVIDSTLKIGKLKAVTPPAGETLEELDVNDLLMSIIYMRQSELDAKGITLEASSNLPKIRYNSADLTQIFNNLLSQSANVLNEIPSSTIKISYEKESKDTKFIVRCSPVKSSKDANEVVGLSGDMATVSMKLAKDIIEKFKGKIWAEIVNNELSIYFTIPEF